MFTDVSDFLESENEIKTTMLASIPAETEILAYRFELETKIMGPNLQNILRQSYDYLTIILRISYDNVKVTIDLRLTSNLQNILRRAQGLFSGTIHLQKP